MVTLLSNIFIKDEYTDDEKRGLYGQLCAVVGIFLNLVLFAIKLLGGAISGSIAITADALNNLSDAGSSIISMIGFKLAGQKPDHEHPYGHGRVEYIAGMAISAIILIVACELIRDSIGKIIHPESTEFSIALVVILLISIAVKCYMAFYNSSVGKKINSATLGAVAKDSLSDCISTTVVLAALIIEHFVGINIDGFAGVVVGIFILLAGIGAMKDTVSPLLGQAPDDDLVADIEETVVGFHNQIVGVHDLLVHDYGPARKIISLHAEVPAEGNILVLHDIIDNLEHHLGVKYNCMATIHMDPVITTDSRVTELKEKVAALALSIHEDITIHDFRVVFGDTHTNLLFDIVVPYKTNLDDEDVVRQLRELIYKNIGQYYFAVIEVDKK